MILPEYIYEKYTGNSHTNVFFDYLELKPKGQGKFFHFPLVFLLFSILVRGAILITRTAEKKKKFNTIEAFHKIFKFTVDEI